MSTRKIIDAKHNGEKVWLKGHAQAIYMSDGSTVEDAINNIENVDLEGYATKNYVDNSIDELVDGAPETLNTLNELAAALKDNADIVDVLNQSISSKQDTLISGSNIKTINGESILGNGDIVVSSGSVSWEDIQNKPTIPSAVTESTVSEWGFTKNTGTVTSVKINGSTKSPSNGVVDLGTVITSHQDISGKQDKLVSGTSIKTINGQSILGSGNITIEGGSGSSDANVQAVDEISTIIDVDLDKYIVETTDDNIILDNNKYYKKTNVSSSISITLNMPEDNTVFTSFSIEFTTSNSGTSVSLPDTIKWLNGELPTFENDFTYQISICNGLGVCAKYV